MNVRGIAGQRRHRRGSARRPGGIAETGQPAQSALEIRPVSSRRRRLNSPGGCNRAFLDRLATGHTTTRTARSPAASPRNQLRPADLRDHGSDLGWVRGQPAHLGSRPGPAHRGKRHPAACAPCCSHRRTRPGSAPNTGCRRQLDAHAVVVLTQGDHCDAASDLGRRSRWPIQTGPRCGSAECQNRIVGGVQTRWRRLVDPEATAQRCCLPGARNRSSSPR